MVLVKKLGLLSFIIFSFLACERIPDWELRPQNAEVQEEWAALQALRPWLWTCRGRQTQFRLGESGMLTGVGIENFLDSFRATGLSIVDIADSKTILGSALLWDEKGHLLSLWHWNDQVSDIECRNDSLTWKKVEFIGEDRPLNLVVYRVDLGESSKFSDSKKWRTSDEYPSLAQDYYVVSSPFPGSMERLEVYPQVYRQNLYTGIDEGLILFQPSLPLMMKAGVLLNSKAELLGFLFQKTSEVWGVALKMSSLNQIVETMIAGGRVSRAHLGMRLRFEKNKGFVVQEIEVGGPAYKAGLRVQDEITKWGSSALKNFSDWPSIQVRDVGKRVSITYRRDENSIESELEIGLAQ